MALEIYVKLTLERKHYRLFSAVNCEDQIEVIYLFLVRRNMVQEYGIFLHMLLTFTCIILNT